MDNIDSCTEEDLTRLLSYSGFILLAFELVKRLIVNPIKLFYADTTFGEGTTFKTYEEDVLSRHKNEFEACLLYLRDFMEAIDSSDVLTVQILRKHRNELAHNLPSIIKSIEIENYITLLENTDKVLFKLSNYQAYMDIGAEPKLQNQGIEWKTLKGPEYVLFESVIQKISLLKDSGA